MKARTLLGYRTLMQGVQLSILSKLDLIDKCTFQISHTMNELRKMADDLNNQLPQVTRDKNYKIRVKRSKKRKRRN